MSKGGGSQTTRTEPWVGAQPYIKDSLRAAQEAFRSPPQFYPGQTFVGALPAEDAAWSQRLAFNDQVFGTNTSQLATGGAPPPTIQPVTTQGPSTQSVPSTGGGSKGGASNQMGAMFGDALGAMFGDALNEIYWVNRTSQTPGATNAPAVGVVPTAGGGKGGLAGGSPTPQVSTPSATPQYSDLTGATQGLLSGGTAGAMANTLSPFAMQQLGGAFQGPGQVTPRTFDASLQQRTFDTALNPGQFTPQMMGPDQITQRSFDPRLEVSNFTPTFGMAGGLDARSAYQQMLSGQPDYAGAQGAIDAANAPLLRQFEQDILPSIAGRGIISGSDTGAIKTLNRVLPELGERMSANALGIMEGERQRALGAQERAAGAVSQGGLQGYGLGLQGAGQQMAANQALAQFGLSQDLGQAGINAQYRGDQLTAAGLGLQGAQAQAGLNQAGAQFGLTQDLARFGLEQDLARFGLEQDLANAGLQSGYRSDVLGLGNLAGSLAGQQSQDMLRGATLWPQVYQMGQQPSADLLGYGGYQRGFNEAALNDAISRWDFQQNQPMNMAQWYSNIAQGFGGLGSQTMSPRQTGGAAGAIGGAAGLGGLAAALGASGPVGWGMAGLGALLGLL